MLYYCISTIVLLVINCIICSMYQDKLIYCYKKKRGHITPHQIKLACIIASFIPFLRIFFFIGIESMLAEEGVI